MIAENSAVKTMSLRINDDSGDNATTPNFWVSGVLVNQKSLVPQLLMATEHSNVYQSLSLRADQQG